MMDLLSSRQVKNKQHKQSLHTNLKMTSHQLRLQFRNLPPVWRIIVIAGLVVTLVLFYKLLIYIFITDLSYHTDNHLCPACYGKRICGKIHETSVHGIKKLHHVNALSNIKNVYFGRINGEELVYKKLGHDDEIEEVDGYLCNGGLAQCGEFKKAKLCAQSSITEGCDVQEAATSLLERLSGPLSVNEVIGLSDMMECPSPRLVKRIVDRYQERSIFNHDHGLSPEDKLKLLYTLAVNPEPIIIQLFPHGEGWPFPAYVGACGRMIAEEYAGIPLHTYLTSDHKTRIRLSLSLLRIADQLTDNASGFKLYFSDISLDNYAVDPTTERVYISDAENIMVVDEQHLRSKDAVGVLPGPHVSVFDKCEHGGNCLTIDTEGLCHSTQADFNYYALCRGLLSTHANIDEDQDYRGFLHSLPDSLPQAKDIVNLVNECANPTSGQSRLVIKEKLLTLLESTVKSFEPQTQKSSNR